MVIHCYLSAQLRCIYLAALALFADLWSKDCDYREGQLEDTEIILPQSKLVYSKQS